MSEERPALSDEWRRLSPWSVAHFSAKSVVQHLQALIFAAPATYGASRWGADELAWLVPLLVIAAVLVSAVLRYHFYAYRLLDGSVQVRRGALFRESLDLDYTRIQNIRVQHPFYLRPLARVTLTIDAAGASGEEVSVPALQNSQAEAMRRHVLERRSGLTPAQRAGEPTGTDAAAAAPEAEVFFTRSVADLIVHGLTNNRAYFALAGVAGVVWQMGFSPVEVAAWLGMRFDISLQELRLIHLVLLVTAATVLAVVVVAALSVLESIVSYYRFTMVRTAQGLAITRGLLTRHEIHVDRSRIQTITITQDWLDRLLDRRNIILEPVSHGQPGDEQRAALHKRILVPSVRRHETALVSNEVLPPVPIDSLNFTPVSRRHLHIRWAAVSALFGLAFLLYLWLALTTARLPGLTAWLLLLLPVAWSLVMARIYLGWRRGGLAIDGDVVVVRSGALGTDYRIFETAKIQDISHIQSLLMRRHGVSSLLFHTAATTIRVPHMSSAFMRSVVDYCLFRVESSGRSWM